MNPTYWFVLNTDDMYLFCVSPLVKWPLSSSNLPCFPNTFLSSSLLLDLQGVFWHFSSFPPWDCGTHFLGSLSLSPSTTPGPAPLILSSHFSPWRVCGRPGHCRDEGGGSAGRPASLAPVLREGWVADSPWQQTNEHHPPISSLLSWLMCSSISIQNTHIALCSIICWGKPLGQTYTVENEKEWDKPME